MSSFFGLGGGGKKDKTPSPAPTPPLVEEKPKEKKPAQLTGERVNPEKSSVPRNVSSKPQTSSSSTSSTSSSSSPDVRMELEVVSTPEPHLVYTNFAYVSPDTYAKFASSEKNSYVSVVRSDDTDSKPPKAYFIIKPHKDLDQGYIALSALQRDSCKLGLNGKVQVATFQVPIDVSFRIVSLKVEVALIPKRKTTVKEAELTKSLLSQFNGHIFIRNQKFACDFEGAGLKLEVRTIEAVADEEKAPSGEDAPLTQFVKIGQLLPTSLLTLEAEETKYFKVEKDQSKARSRLFSPNFQFSDFNIGGLDKEFNQIFRRAFASRLFPAEVIEQWGIKHVRGMLLYGPPGTGKTLIARQIGKMLNTREPKVVNGPEILNKFVGASEENIRKLFADAEADYAVNKENSDLHLIIFDEIDAICKARGSDRSGTGVHDTVVNQLLSKLDGVNSLNNILVIGMTNRKDLIDPALLRPGRLEVHIEISLPTEDGRVDILKIHTKKMRENGKLGKDVDLRKLAQLTKNFSGAEIEGLVKSAASFALYGSVDVTRGTVGVKENDAQNLVINMDHFLAALEEVQPAFGVAEEDLKSLIRRPPIDFGIEFADVLKTVRTLIRQLQNGDRDVLSVLLEGSPGCGKSLVAAQLALDSGFPFVKLISPDDFVGMSDASKANEINRVFEDAYKSTVSLVVVDGIERLLEYVPIGPRFSNTVLQTLMVLFNRSPPKEKHKIFIIATTNNSQILQDMLMLSVFSVIQTVPQISKPSQVKTVFEALEAKVAEGELDTIASECVLPISMGNLLLVIDMAKQDTDSITADKFKECLIAAKLTTSMKY